jgi:hypothetical protein
MIPRDDEFDMYVSEGALVEVWRGEHITVAQQFSADWDGAPASCMHPAVFVPLPVDPPPVPVGTVDGRYTLADSIRSIQWWWMLWAATIGSAFAYGVMIGWW